MLKQIRSIVRRAKEDGVTNTAAFVASKSLRAVTTGTVQPANTIEANLEEWSTWDWSKQGEEWTPSEDWKSALVTHVLDPYIPSGSRVLEIGPGGGRWTEFLIQRASHVDAVDLTPACIELCRERFRNATNVSFHVNDGKDLSFIPTASMDRIWSFDVFVHIQAKDIAEYVRQFARILAPNGAAVIHHAARGRQTTGWRSDMTRALMAQFCAANRLLIERELTSWGGDRYHINPGSPDNPTDVVTIIRKPS